METECLAPYLNATLSPSVCVSVSLSLSALLLCYLSVVMSSGVRGLTQLKEEKHDAHIYVHLSFFMIYTEVKWEECFSFNAAYCLMIFSMIPSGEVRNCRRSRHRKRFENNPKTIRRTWLNIVSSQLVLLAQAQLEKCLDISSEMSTNRLEMSRHLVRNIQHRCQ